MDWLQFTRGFCFILTLTVSGSISIAAIAYCLAKLSIMLGL